MSAFDLLLVDLTTRGGDADLLAQLQCHFQVRMTGSVSRMHTNLKDARPSLLCFEFDFPDTAGLNMLRETKRQFASVPLVMVTLRHTADLAVWALRAGVWDYFVKPVPEKELLNLVTRLHGIRSANTDAALSRPVAEAQPVLPREIKVLGGKSGRLALQPALEYVDRNLGQKISEEAVAEACGMSLFRFSRAFRKEHGLTFKSYVTRRRIEQALNLLRDPRASVAEVSFLVGFADQSYFARVFRRCTGMTPSDFADLANGDQPGSLELVEGLTLKLAPPQILRARKN